MKRNSKKTNPSKPTPPAKNSDVSLPELERIKQQWIETIDAMPDPLALVTHDYEIAKANKAMAKVSGKDIKSIIGLKCYEAFANRSSPCENCSMKKALPGNDSHSYEVFNSTNNSWYEVASKPITLSDGTNAVVQIYRDRTERKKLQHQLAQQEKLGSIGQLAGGFAHEINNPLGGIIVFSQMLLREMDSKSVHYQDVVEIEAAAKRCKTIVENLLDYSRQRPLKPNFQPTDLHKVLANAVKFAELGHNQNNRCDVELNLDATPQEIITDQNRLTQVLLNLCVNALQAMAHGGTLSISSQPSPTNPKNRFEIHIEDTGMGIAPKNLSRIFEPFFTTKEPGQGTGLGLSIVHGILEDLGGKISVNSTVGKGTRFTVELPLVKS